MCSSVRDGFICAVIGILLAIHPAWVAGNPGLALEVVENPGALEPIVLRAWYPGCTQVAGVEFVDGEFRVILGSTLCGVPPEGPFSEDLSLGRLPAGKYRARLYSSSVPAQPIGEVLEIVVAPAASNPELEVPGLLDLSGVWWNPQRNGESFFIQHETVQDVLLVAWNKYDANGKPEWLVGVLVDRSGSGFTGALLRPSASGLTYVGDLSIGHSASTHQAMSPRLAEALVDVNGVHTRIPLQRYWLTH